MRDRRGSLVASVATSRKNRLAGLDVPVAILAPEEAVERLRRFVEPVALERCSDVTDGLVELEQDPFVVARQESPVDLALHLAPLHLAEAAGIPKLVAEVAAQLDILLVEQHILAERGAAHRAEAQRIGAVLGDEFERVGRVAQALAHLAAQLVADDAGEIDVAERQVPHELVARHDHACHPEEDDVRAGDQVAGGIELLERRRLLRPAHRGKRPQPGAEPGVEDVFVLNKPFVSEPLSPSWIVGERRNYSKRILWASWAFR